MVQLKNLLPEGVDITHTEDYALSERAASIIQNTLRGFGYRPIKTPAFEYLDLYKETLSGLNVRDMLKFISPEGDIMVMRPDATIPVSRIAARNYGEEDGYLKFFYSGSIFRQKESKKGEPREFLQMGVEYFGNEKPVCDAEVIASGIEAVLAAGLTELHIDMGQVEFLSSLLDESGLNGEERKVVIKLIESKNQGELERYLLGTGIDEKFKNVLLEIPRLYGKPEKVFETAKEIAVNEGMKKAIINLEEVYEALIDYGYGDYVIFDLGFTNPLDYYTGVIFKGYAKSYGKPIIQGGRYDHLAEKFGTEKPASGFGINVNNLVEVLGMENTAEKEKYYTDYLVIYKEENRKEAFNISKELRMRGFIVESDVCIGDMKSQMETASRRNTKEIVEVSDDTLRIISLLKNDVEKLKTNDFLKRMDESDVSPIH